ncbi:MAG: cyclic nucleotide-binding domain-containing protein, partial [Vicinamibacterales bacterium]
LLAENVELTEGIFRMLIRKRGPAHTRVVVHGELPPDLKARTTHLLPIEGVLLLQSIPLLAHATAEQLWNLSAMFKPVSFKSGEEVLSPGGEASMLIVLSGSLHSQPDTGEPQTADSGDLVGMYETLSGTPFAATVTASADGLALKCGRADILDALADNTDLLQGIFSGLLHARE